MKLNLLKQLLRFSLCLSIAVSLTYCSGGGDSGGNGGNGKKIHSTLNISIQGINTSLSTSQGLILKFPDDSEQTFSDNSSFQYSNQGKEKQSNTIEIIAHPAGQACIIETDPNGDSSGNTLNIGINCGLANVITVSGIQGTLSSPLVITRDLSYYQNQNLSVSSFALMSIHENSGSFQWDASGQPSVDNHYSFLYTVAFDDVPGFEQDIRILEQPTGYQCFSFEGQNGNHQIHCSQLSTPNDPSYELAQKCVAIKPINSESYLETTGPDSYALSANDLASAEKFFLKPSRLGAFMFHDREEKFLTRTEINELAKGLGHDQSIEWVIRPGEQIVYKNQKPTLVTGTLLIPFATQSFHMQHDLSFGLKETPEEHNDSSYQATGQLFDLVIVDDSECTSYPEAALDAVIDPSFYTPKDPAQAVYGYADIHAHYAFPRAIGGMAMSGDLVHPYGIAHALGDCNGLHGSNGGDDLLGSQGGGGNHNVTGYPEFTEWPNHETVTHVTTYYRWIQRAYLSGLRLSVTLATGNPTFCEVLEQMNPGKKKAGCKGVAAVTAQSNYIYQIQDYVDAQEGGPGKGWFRVVTSPAQARQVISENKLAVVLGSEHGELFNCRERSGCSNSWIDSQVQAAYDLGVRMFFPVHRFDNKFAGTRVAGGSRNAWMNLTNKISTSKAANLLDIVATSTLPPFGVIGGHYWDVEECPGLPDHAHDVNGTNSMYSMVDFKNNELSIITDPLGPFGAAVEAQLGPFEPYVGFRQGEGGNACNTRGLNPEGEYLLQALMNKGLLIDIDHMSYYAAESAMDIIQANNYSGVSSSHGWTENSIRFRNRVLQQGGVMGIMNTTPTSFANQTDWMRDNLSTGGYMSSFALGSDIQGVTSQPGVDATAAGNINYPFTSLDGKVTFLPPQTGNRAFDYESEGIAHYGLYAEWVENLRQIDQTRGDDVLAQFMNSAEAFLQMWERAEASAVN